MGFPVLSSDLIVMCKQYLHPEWSTGGCEWEQEVHAALQLLSSSQCELMKPHYCCQRPG